MIRVFALSLATLFMLTGPALAQDNEATKAAAIDLKWKWQVGKTFGYRMELLQEQTLMPQNVKQRTSTVFYWTQRVEKLDEKGQAHLTTTYKRVTLKQKGRKGTLDFDSQKPGLKVRQNLQLQIMTALIDKPFVMVITPAGKVLKVTGVDEIGVSMCKKLPNDPRMLPVKARIKKSLSNKTMREQMEGSLQCLPGKPVMVGDKWTRGPMTKDHSYGGVLVTDRYTFRSLSSLKGRRIAVIEGEHDMFLKLTNKEAPALKVFDITPKFRDNKSTIRFDKDGGFLKKQVHKFTLHLRMKARKENVTMDQTIVQTTTVELIDPEDISKSGE